MKKILLILLIIPCIVFAADNQKLSDQEIKEKIQPKVNLLQDKIIETLKKTVPRDIDEYTVLQDVYKNNDELFYILSLKNVSKDDFNDEAFRAFFRRKTITKYCDTSKKENDILQVSQLAFTNGASYIYSFGDEKPFVIHVDHSSCPKQ